MYLDEVHKCLARNVEEGELLVKWANRLIGIELGFMPIAISGIIAAGWAASIGMNYLPAALGWLFGILAFIDIIAFIATLTIINEEMPRYNGIPWLTLRKLKRDLDDYVEEKVNT